MKATYKKVVVGALMFPWSIAFVAYEFVMHALGIPHGH